MVSCSISKSNSFVCVRQTLLAAGILLASLSIASAQGVGANRGLPGTSGGIHTIQGRVYSPSGMPMEALLRVRIESPNVPNLSTITDSNGEFRFNSLEAGEYRLTVEGGKQFEDSIEYPYIYREASAGGRIIRLAIQLRFKPEANPSFAGMPKDAVDLYSKGLESAKKGDSKKAIDQFSGAVAAYANFPAALVELGIQHLKLGQVDKAAEALKSAARLSPGDFSTHLNYGIALLNKRNFAEAETELRTALRLNGNLPTAHMYLGIALMSQKRLDEAEQELLKATASNSSEVASAHRYLGGIYWGKRDYKKAADSLEAYLKLAPKAADAEKTQAAIKELRSKQ